MSARKLFLLLAILLMGGALEGAFNLRGHMVFGPQGCHLRGDAFDGPYFDYADERRLETPAALALRVDNAFGRVQVSPGAAGFVLVKLHKRVYTREEGRARGLSQRVELRTKLEGQALQVTTNREELERFMRVVGCGGVTGPYKTKWKDRYQWTAHAREDIRKVGALLAPCLCSRKIEQFRRTLEAWDGYTPSKRSSLSDL